jgi:5-methylcytosine-specific restriction protein A
MPTKPKRLCPKCGQVVSGRCERCDKAKEKQYDKDRGTASERGYGWRWQKARKAYLARNPLCVTILDDGLPCNRPATDVDHDTPVTGPNDPSFWDEEGWRSRCHPCHSAKTAKEGGKQWRMPVASMASGVTRTVVCGPPGSGKSTYVNERRKAGDFVWDFDEVSRVLLGKDARGATPQERELLVTMLNAAIGGLVPVAISAWIIVSTRAWAGTIAKRLRGTVVEMDTPIDECVRRIEGRDPAGARRDELIRVVQGWATADAS